MLVFQTETGGVVRQLVTRRDEVVALLTPPPSPRENITDTTSRHYTHPHPHTEYKCIYVISEIGKKMMNVATIME
jgi:hypothetical protein